VSQVVARLKRQSVAICKVMSSDHDIINLPDLANAIPFDPHYKIEDNQWFRISEFSDTEFADAALGAAINTADFVQLQQTRASDVKFICIIQGHYRLYQRIVPSHIIKKKWITISGEFSLVEGERILLINEVPDAIHNTQTDNLYFSDFSVLKSFFSKIEKLYRDATDAEVDAFLQNEVIKAVDDFTSEKVSKPNRHRIALAQDKLAAYSADDVKALVKDFPDYIKDVKIENGAFIITNDNDLKLAIFCIEERYYTTPISKERRLANSVLRLDGNG
jgi:hypothetical protein